MRTLIVVFATLLLLAAPVVAEETVIYQTAAPNPENLADVLTPDAALYARTLNGSGAVEGISWRIAHYREARGWVDVLRPLDTPGVGLSADWGRAVCIGGGYQRGWIGYVGAHVGF